MTVSEEIQRYEPELVALRRDIHAHPETGFEEFRTAALVAAKLREWGIAVTEQVGKTGVVGTLRGKRVGQRAIGLRADMDALFIHEENTFAHVSTNPGKMHACGHDGHTAMLLGAARYLAENPDFGGTVQFIFQPAEEAGTGAAAMIEDGLFDRFPVDSVYGLHNFPGIPVGKFATRSGPTLAGGARWTVTFNGTGGHGASAHLATDATVALGQFLLAVHTIITRNVRGIDPAALSVGYVHGGTPGSPNVMPAKVVASGTARYFEPDVRATMGRRLGELATTLAAVNGCTAEVEFEQVCPPTINHAEKMPFAAAAVAATVGAQNMGELPLSTGGEDFAFMLQKKPGVFMRIGNGLAPDGSFHNVHTPKYDFNDDILVLGAAYWVSLVHQELDLQDAGA